MVYYNILYSFNKEFRNWLWPNHERPKHAVAQKTNLKANNNWSSCVSLNFIYHLYNLSNNKLYEARRQLEVQEARHSSQEVSTSPFSKIKKNTRLKTTVKFWVTVKYVSVHKWLQPLR